MAFGICRYRRVYVQDTRQVRCVPVQQQDTTNVSQTKRGDGSTAAAGGTNSSGRTGTGYSTTTTPKPVGTQTNPSPNQQYYYGGCCRPCGYYQNRNTKSEPWNNGDERPMNQKYPSENDVTSLIRHELGNDATLIANAADDGGRRGIQVAQAVGPCQHRLAFALFPRKAYAKAAQIGYSQGYAEGTKRGQDSAAVLRDKEQRKEIKTEKDKNDLIDSYINDMEGVIDKISDPVSKENAKQRLESVKNLKKIPLSVMKEFGNMSDREYEAVKQDLLAAGDSKVKQAAALAKHCPAALGAAMDAMLEKKGDGTAENYDLKADLQKNGAEFLRAYAGMSEADRGKLKDKVGKLILGKGMSINNLLPKGADESKDVSKPFLTQENLQVAKGILEQLNGENDKQVLKTFMDDVADVARPYTSHIKWNKEDLKLLNDSGIPKLLYKADKDAFNSFAIAIGWKKPSDLKEMTNELKKMNKKRKEAKAA